MFQRPMDSIFRQLNFALIYLDDNLMASFSDGEYFERLRQAFSPLSIDDLVINESRCVFGVTELHYLDLKVTIQGIQPLTSRF